MDLLSDIVQTISLYKNCHNDLCGGSIAIVISSYVTTALYVKFEQNSSWFEAFSYPKVFG